MGIEVFNRYENKYLIDTLVFEKMEEILSKYMELDKYNRQNKEYKITNIYYDTDDSHLIRTSLQKPRYKEKLRIRSYGVPEEDDYVYIEIKKKVCGLVNKRRTAMRLSYAYEFLTTGEIKNIDRKMNMQVINEIKYILNSYDNLKPKIYLSYDRKAYFDKEDKNLRISFDKNILSRNKELLLEKGSYGEILLPENKVLMEIKVVNSMPLWLTKTLSEYNIYQTSFSKYGEEYKKRIKGGKEECLVQFSKLPPLTQTLKLATS